jgi:hypothetical protein
MPTTATKERLAAVLHQRHGWIDAPEGYWIEKSANGKTFWLCSDREPQPGDRFPYGTRWNATSIVAW